MEIKANPLKLVLLIELLVKKKKLKQSSASAYLHLQFLLCRDSGSKLFPDYASGSLQREVCCELKHVNNAAGMLLINAAMWLILESRTFEFSELKGNRWGVGGWGGG